MKNLLVFLLLAIIAGSSASAQISIRQESILDLVESDSGEYYEVNIKSEPFTLEFEGDELMVCAGLTEELFQYTQADTDINADFNSYFFIFKFLAMEHNADYLPTGKDEAASLNETHGAKPKGDGTYHFKVNSLLVGEEEKPIGAFDEFFLALWLDQNKDQFIDKEELLKVKINTN